MQIYIPIWLDLLSISGIGSAYWNPDLHSNMVRFIIGLPTSEPLGSYVFTFQYG